MSFGEPKNFMDNIENTTSKKCLNLLLIILSKGMVLKDITGT